jgi:hypothetical protein
MTLIALGSLILILLIPYRTIGPAPHGTTGTSIGEGNSTDNKHAKDLLSQPGKDLGQS